MLLGYVQPAAVVLPGGVLHRRAASSLATDPRRDGRLHHRRLPVPDRDDAAFHSHPEAESDGHTASSAAASGAQAKKQTSRRARSFRALRRVRCSLVSCASVMCERWWSSHNEPRAIADPKALGLFPQQVGSYKLEHAWNEYLVSGPLIFYWAEYAPANGGAHVSVGISPVLGAHDTLLCHSARGEDRLWHDTGPCRLQPNPRPASAHRSSIMELSSIPEATTVCSGPTCGQYASARQHFGLVYSRPDTYRLLSQSPLRPIPVLLRTETSDTARWLQTWPVNSWRAICVIFSRPRTFSSFTQP